MTLQTAVSKPKRGRKFPLNLPPVAWKEDSVAQDVAFAREDIATSIRFLDQPEHSAIRSLLGEALTLIDQLDVPKVLKLGCWRCNGDVPADDPELVADRICRPCAIVYDAAVVRRREAMRQARQARRAA